MRIAIGGMTHESNTFTHETTSLDEFNTKRGEAVYDSERWMNGAVGGIVDTLREREADIVPSFFAKALPSGTVEANAYERMSSEIVDRIEDGAPVDGVCLHLHGSMCAEGCDDPEGDLLVNIRMVVGENTPIVCSLDMHATVTEQMVDAADGFTGYRTAPHTDVYETGARAASLLHRSLKDELEMTAERVYLPILIAGEQSETDSPPMNRLMNQLREVEQQPGILSAAYFLGFPWADSPHNGVSAVVVGTQSAAEDVRRRGVELAAEFWAVRHRFGFTTEAHSFEDALDLAVDETETPVVIADSGDNPTAGASEDLVITLDQLLERGASDVLYAVIRDGEAVETCRDGGVDAMVDVELGRLWPSARAPGLEVEAAVKRLVDLDDTSISVVEIDGVTVVLTDKRTAVTDPELLRDAGEAPEEYDIVVAKSGYLSPAYQQLAERTLLALTPGDTNEILSELPYERVPQPMYPLEEDVTWSPPSQ